MEFLQTEPPLEFWAWTQDLSPRTCLVVNWLAELGAVPDPGERVRERAKRFSNKVHLLETMACQRDEALSGRARQLIEQGDLDAFVAWFLWMNFVESVPRRFLLPTGRERVLSWVKTQLGRPELTPAETVRELWWRADLIRCEAGEDDVLKLLRN
jgi:hypothetical protein